MKTFTPSSSNTLSSLSHFTLGKHLDQAQHHDTNLLSIIGNFYYDATKLLQADNCIIEASN